jgi:pseudoazurin
MPPAVLAEQYEIQGVNYRNYDSMFFEPAFLEVRPGDSITFLVTDFDHQPQSVFVPAGAEQWKAEPGQSITVEFSQQGLYIYDCAYHNVMGMAGVILVGDPENLDEAREFFEHYKRNTFALNEDRLDPIWNLLAQGLSQKSGH